MARQPSHTRVKIVFLIATVFLTAIFLLLYLRINNLITASEDVDRTRLVQIELETVYSELIQAETAQRGFVISHDSTILADFYVSIKDLNRHLRTVDSILRDNSKQQRNLHLLQRLIHERVDFIKGFISYNPNDPIDPQLRIRGKQLRNKVRLQVTRMQQTEERLLAERTERLERESFITPVAMIFLFFACVIIVLATYYRIIRDLRSSDELRSAVIEREVKLINQTNKLIEAQQLAHIGSWDWDLLTNTITRSDELCRIYGIPPGTPGEDFEAFLMRVHPDDREYARNVVQDSTKERKPFTMFYRLIRTDGTIVNIRATGTVFTNEKGEIIRLTGTAQDVTEQKEYEEKLRLSEQSFLNVFNNNPVALSLTDVRSNVIRHANKAFYTVFGFSEEEVIGKSSRELNIIDPEEAARLTEILLTALKETRSAEELQHITREERESILLKLRQSEVMNDLEVLYTRKNGEKFPAVVSFEVITFQNESFTVTTYQDVTNRKKTEHQLKKQNTDLASMNKELESFNYIASHDLQEPLRHIQMFASRIMEAEQENLSKKGVDYFDRMQAAAGRMQTLIADLLAYSRLNKGEYVLEDIDLNEIVSEVLEVFSEAIVEKDAIIEYNGLGNLQIIEFQFRQLIANLISNSLKFAQPGIAPHIKITREDIVYTEDMHLGLLPEKKYAHLRFSDNGMGFEPQYKEHIFEVFKRLHNKATIRGTGIGLSIVKKIVENHNGAIRATGELNKGACFDVYIPVG